MFSVKHAMIPVLSVLIGVSSACSSTQWVKRSPVLEREYDVFDTSSVTGTGLKLYGDNYQPRKCIKSSDSATTGGLLSLEFLNPSAVISGERGPYRDFIKAALLRASAYNVTGMKPVSIACVVSVSGKMNYLIDNSIQFTELAESFLKRNDIDGFYRHCGTRLIDSILFETAFAFVITYYMPADDADYFSGRIKYGRESGTADVGNFAVFSEVGNRYPVFFSMSGTTDSLFIPVEFPVASSYGKGIDYFIEKIVNSCLASTSGRITSFHLKKWGELPDVNKYMPSGRGNRFPEDAHDRTEGILQDIRDFAVFRLSLENAGTDKNGTLSATLGKKITWGNFYKCSWGMSDNAYITPDQEKDCRELLDGLRNYKEFESYNPLSGRLGEDSKLSRDTFREVRLIDAATLSGEDGSSGSDYRFNDRTLYVKIPEKVVPGQTMDASGKIYSSDCIKRDSVTFISSKNDGLSLISNDCYPAGSRDWGLMKRTLLFWEKPPFSKPLYRGTLEVAGFSDEISDGFILTGDAEDLARKDILKFYKKFGTHYVSQVRGRRGIVYYFSQDSVNDSDIHLESYGISLSRPEGGDVTIPADISGGCLFSLLGKIFKNKREEPLLHPETVSGFFTTKEDFSKIIREGSESVPMELYLKPWSQYLVERGIIRIDQTIPARLFSDKRGESLEGAVAITDGNGDSYEGTLSNGLKNGYGVLKTGRGAVYKGGWIGDLMHGKGMYKDESGNVYSGDFMYGYFHGKGENKDAEGNIYRGDFYKGKITGRGEMQYKDGRKYRGEFRDGEPDGFGIMEDPEGRKYEGTFKKGVFQKKQLY